MIDPQAVGTIPQWGTLGAVAVAIIAAWKGLIFRRADSDDSMRKDLLSRINQLETKMLEDRKACIEEQKFLQERIREQDSIIAGLQRQFIAAQVAWAQAIPPGSLTPAIEDMVRQLRDLGRLE